MRVRFPLGVRFYSNIYKSMIWFLLLGSIVFLAVLVFLAEEFFNLLFRGYAPFISTKNKVLDEAVKQFQALNLPAGAKIYELGCGQAGFLRRLEKSAKSKYTLIGVEILAAVYLLAKAQLAMVGSKIKLRHKNFLKMSLTSGDCFYCYLGESLTARLSLKLQKEARPGSYLISNQFHLPGYEPIKEVQIGLTSWLRVYKL